MRLALYLLALVFVAVQSTAQSTNKTFDAMFPDFEKEKFRESSVKLLESLSIVQGQVALDNGLAALTVGEDYYYLPPDSAKIVLVDLWGNPDDIETLGMLFPSTMTPMDDNSWGVEITWDAIGYVSDTDADKIDYADLLKTLQKDTKDESKWREESGYGTIELVGWADTPYYNAQDKKLHWAKDLVFDSSDYHMLNYNLRALGRRGVLQFNFIAGMDQLDEIKRALPQVAAMSTFTSGNTYADFDPSIDTVAAVGIGGLIAGKVLTKAGLFATVLLFLKKFWFLLLIPFIWIKKFIPRKYES